MENHSLKVTEISDVKPTYLAVIVKPTYDCNLACSYCSVEGKETHSRMSLKTVDRLLSSVTEFCGTGRTIYLIWHGGEPLLMSPEFYDHIGRSTLEYKDYKIINAVQTNATLLNNEFIDIFVKYGFRVSISLDGPAELHDMSRRDRQGDPTFERVMESVAALKSRQVPIGAITVLNKLNVGRMPEIYKFFNREGVHLRINPVQRQGRADTAYSEVALSPREYGREMIKIFNMWYGDANTQIMVDPFRLIIGNIVTDTTYSCDFRRCCHNEVISVSPDGGVYPCGQFNGVSEHYLGNIYSENIEDIMKTPNMRKLQTRVPENIEVCRVCEYSEICNCGCTVSALTRKGNILEPDFYCAGRKMLFQHIIDTLEQDFSPILGQKNMSARSTPDSLMSIYKEGE